MAKQTNKVIINGVTRIDLTGDTVTADKLYKGVKAHANDGSVITGTAEVTVSGENIIIPSGFVTLS